MPQALNYKLAQCCSPQLGDAIRGYFKLDGTIAVHKSECASIRRVPGERLLAVTWDEIAAAEIPEEEIETEFAALEPTDYFILKHHQEFGMDYSIVVAETLGIAVEEAHQRHRHLRELGALKRVEKLIVQYRKNIVKGKWIKHRNHTYYELTPLGEKWIRHFESLTE